MDGATALPATLPDLAGELARLEAIIEGWAEGTRDVAQAYRHAIDALHAEALRRLLRALRDVPALREVAADDVVYAVLRHHGLVKPGIAERVEAALEQVRPLLASHGGDVALVSVDPPRLSVRFIGACDNCPASTLTIDAALRGAVRAACPEITDIVQVKETPRGLDKPADIAGWLPAGLLADIPDGGVRPMELRGRAVILARQGDGVRCYDNACVHLGERLHDGPVRDNVLTCPWHGFRFDLRNGACETAPGMALRAHQAQVVAGRLLVRLAA